MKKKTKLFGLILSISSLIVSFLTLGLFGYLCVSLYQSMISLKNNGVEGAITYLATLILLIIIAFITIILLLFTIYQTFFFISVVKAYKGGKLKIRRKIGIVIATIFIMVGIGCEVWVVLSSSNDIYLYLIPILIIANGICQIVFYCIHKTETKELIKESF